MAGWPEQGQGRGDELTIHNLVPDLAALEDEEPPALINAPIAAGGAMAVPGGHHWVKNTGKTARSIFCEPMQ